LIEKERQELLEKADGDEEKIDDVNYIQVSAVGVQLCYIENNY
jgi:hypothetical protein